MKKLFIFFICNIALGLTLLAQNNIDPLDRNISINVTNMPIIEFLNKVSQIGKFTFSYNPNKLNASQKITCNLNNKTIRQILAQTLPNNFTFKSSGNHIILVVSQIQKPTQVTKPKYFKISGTITDQYTASKVSEVSVYDKKTLHSAVTDESGNFSLTIPYQNEEVLLRIKKEGYSDSSLYIKRDDLKFLEISLRPEKAMEISISIPKDSNAVNENSNTDTTMVSFVQDSNIVAINEKSKMFDRILFLINNKMGLHYRNIKDTLFEKMQISFLPGLSTNRLISGNIINKYSFNILGGVSKGVKKLEIGGLFNIDRNKVNNCQLAGLFNIVGGKVNGYQAAGLINIVNDSIKGFQNAGLINITTKQIDGAQITGLGNISKSAKGVQIAGLYNISKTVNGAQIGGLFNVTHTIKGIQIAGLLNVAKIVNGIQVAGLLNVAQKVKNQIGFINIADSCSGIPIGFLTIVKNGYHKLEYSADEVFNYNLSFRTGVRRFYNIFGIGSNLTNGTNFSWSYTYGVGTSFKLHKKLFLDLDLQCSQLANQGYAQYLSLNNRLNVGLDWQFAKKASLTFGPSFNTYVVDKQNYANNSFYEKTGKSYPSFSYITNGNIDVKSWIGWKVGLRLF